MTVAERGFLLLCGDLGDGLTPLSLPQLELLRRRMTGAVSPGNPDADLTVQDLQKLGYGENTANRLTALFHREAALDAYLAAGAEKGCVPLTCVSDGFPQQLRPRLGRRCPAVLFYKGNPALLQEKRIAVVGSRELLALGKESAKHLGSLAAETGYTLVSGNARGADKTAQAACLDAGGCVISVVSEALWEQDTSCSRILYLAESGWHLPFSPARALSRNRLIYALGEKSFVVQCGQKGGTLKGSEDALKHGITEVFAEDDGSDGAKMLSALGATLIHCGDLTSFDGLSQKQTSFYSPV